MLASRRALSLRVQNPRGTLIDSIDSLPTSPSVTDWTDRARGYTSMRLAHVVHRFPAALMACLALAFVPDLRAQEPPGLSSGTGQGTGTGRSAGIQRNRTGSNSGRGPERCWAGARFRGRGTISAIRPSQPERSPRPRRERPFSRRSALGPLLSGEEARGPAAPREPRWSPRKCSRTRSWSPRTTTAAGPWRRSHARRS